MFEGYYTTLHPLDFAPEGVSGFLRVRMVGSGYGASHLGDGV